MIWKWGPRRKRPPSIGPGRARNNARACGIIIINGCVLLVCCRKIAEQRGPRAATGSLLPQADFSGGFTIRDANRASGARECHGVRWSWMDKEDGWVAGRVTKSSGGYFYAKLLVRRVNICMASRERVHLFLSLCRRRTNLSSLFRETWHSQEWKFRSNIWRFYIIIFVLVNYPQIKTTCFILN